MDQPLDEFYEEGEQEIRICEYDWYDRIGSVRQKDAAPLRMEAIFCKAVNTKPLELRLIGLTAVLGH